MTKSKGIIVEGEYYVSITDYRELLEEYLEDKREIKELKKEVGEYEKELLEYKKLLARILRTAGNEIRISDQVIVELDYESVQIESYYDIKDREQVINLRKEGEGRARAD